MSNQEIKELLKKEKIYEYQIAETLGICEATFSKWFRKQLSPDRVHCIMVAVQKIKEERAIEIMGTDNSEHTCTTSNHSDDV